MATPLLLTLLTVSLAGCGWFKFGSKYDEVEENRPLEVPPDLSQPDTRGEIVVPPPPPGSSGGTQVSEVPDGADAGATTPLPTSDELPADNERVAWSVDEGELALTVFDGIDSVWRRTGFALERAGFVIDARDEARRLYQVEYEDSPPEEESEGFFGTISGWFSSDDETPNDLSGRYAISLIGEGASTRVMVLDEAGNPVVNRAARNMLVLLHERLS